jgi:hypothetical protein
MKEVRRGTQRPHQIAGCAGRRAAGPAAVARRPSGRRDAPAVGRSCRGARGRGRKPCCSPGPRARPRAAATPCLQPGRIGGQPGPAAAAVGRRAARRRRASGPRARSRATPCPATRAAATDAARPLAPPVPAQPTAKEMEAAKTELVNEAVNKIMKSVGRTARAAGAGGRDGAAGGRSGPAGARRWRGPRAGAAAAAAGRLIRGGLA